MLQSIHRTPPDDKFFILQDIVGQVVDNYLPMVTRARSFKTTKSSPHIREGTWKDPLIFGFLASILIPSQACALFLKYFNYSCNHLQILCAVQGLVPWIFWAVVTPPHQREAAPSTALTVWVALTWRSLLNPQSQDFRQTFFNVCVFF